MVNENNNFKIGDSVYYLGGDMTDPSSNPSTVWKIDNISMESKIISLTEIENSSNYKVFSNFNIELMRHISPTTTIPVPISISIPPTIPVPISINDSKFERQWHITDINNKQISISTDNIDCLNINDIVKVVSSNEIYRPQINDEFQTPMNGGIVFAPVIKVYNGNEGSFEPKESAITVPKEIIFKNAPLTDEINGSDLNSNKINESVVSSVLDFTKNLIVKKMP
jgi:hypothetical protein